LNVMDVIRNRRSVSRMLDEAISRSDMEDILEAGLWAPNHRFTQPWKFHVVTGDARRDAGEVLAASALTDSELRAPDMEQKAKKGRSYFLQAPVVVVVSISRSEDEVTDNEDYATGAMAAQNMMLAAWSKGIASKLRTGEYSFSTEIKDHFGIPSENRIVGFLFLGYPADRAVPPARQRDDGNVIWVS